MTKRKTRRLNQQLYHNFSRMMDEDASDPDDKTISSIADFQGESMFRATLEEIARTGGRLAAAARATMAACAWSNAMRVA